MRVLAITIGLLGACATPALALAHGFAHAHEASVPVNNTATPAVSAAPTADDTHQHATIGAEVSRRAVEASPPVAHPESPLRPGTPKPVSGWGWRADDPLYSLRANAARFPTGPPLS